MTTFFYLYRFRHAYLLTIIRVKNFEIQTIRTYLYSVIFHGIRFKELSQNK